MAPSVPPSWPRSARKCSRCSSKPDRADPKDRAADPVDQVVGPEGRVAAGPRAEDAEHTAPRLPTAILIATALPRPRRKHLQAFHRCKPIAHENLANPPSGTQESPVAQAAIR